jgi:hypothetical protein
MIEYCCQNIVLYNDILFLCGTHKVPLLCVFIFRTFQKFLGFRYEIFLLAYTDM